MQHRRLYSKSPWPIHLTPQPGDSSSFDLLLLLTQSIPDQKRGQDSCGRCQHGRRSDGGGSNPIIALKFKRRSYDASAEPVVVKNIDRKWDGIYGHNQFRDLLREACILWLNWVMAIFHTTACMNNLALKSRNRNQHKQHN